MARIKRNCLLCERAAVSLGEIRCQRRRCLVDQHEAITCKHHKPDRSGVGTWTDVIPQTVTMTSRRGSVTVRL
ncbi:MAG TPA: hypothetical protein VM537_06785 [Anaerolineae bacterium]|nr:hypothetical protein [Anaerolineae bacterium]